MVQGIKRTDIFTNKFQVGQRVRSVRSGYVGTIIAVDPHSFNPPHPAPGKRRRARRNPYQVRYDHWTTLEALWIPELELEPLTE